jgi:hypothetical protein
VTFTRLVLILVGGLLLIDKQFGNGQLAQSVSAQTMQLGYRLSDQFSTIVRRISP